MQDYPVYLTRSEHDFHAHAGDALVIVVSLLLLSGAGGYYLGHEHGVEASRVLPQHEGALPCAASAAYIVEQTYKHRGVVFYRECFAMKRPNGARTAAH